jgi:hypothetical protein
VTNRQQPEAPTMTNPRDPEGLMPDADEAGPPVGADGALPDGDAAVGGGSPDADPTSLAGRTDTDRFGSDPDVRFPGESEDPTMTTADAQTAPVTAEPPHSEAEALDPDVGLRNPGV